MDLETELQHDFREQSPVGHARLEPYEATNGTEKI